MRDTVYILLGSNLGDKEKNLKAALSGLNHIEGLSILTCSRRHIFKAEYMADTTPEFLNQAVEATSELSPIQLLDELESLEHRMGRTNKGENLSRIIDLDILLFGNVVTQTTRLTIPHPRLHLRQFALVPLVEIAPDIVHPVSGKPLKDLVHPVHCETPGQMSHDATING